MSTSSIKSVIHTFEPQSSTNDYVVCGDIIESKAALFMSFTCIYGTAAMRIKFEGADKSDFSDAFVLVAEADRENQVGSYVTNPAAYAYYRLMIKSKVLNVPGIATLSYCAKG